MRIELQRNEVARLINQVTKAVESRNTIPILGHVRLVVAAGALTATATDLDIEVSGSIPASGDDMAFCVDAKLLAGIVGKIAGDTIVVELADKRVTIKAGRSRFTLDTLPVDDFPTMQAGTFDADLTLDLAALVAPVQFAMSDEMTRFYLCGVYIHSTATGVMAVATDGHRLAKNHIDMSAPPFGGVILPRKLVGLLPKGEVSVAVGAAKVRIVSGDITIISKLIDGTFPDYERVIPSDNGRIVEADGQTLLAATERVSIISSERGRAVKATCEGDKITLTVDGDKAVEDIDAHVSDTIEIGFNASYLAEVLRTIGTGPVRFAMEPSAPAVVTGQQHGLLIVLMPMRV